MSLRKVLKYRKKYLFAEQQLDSLFPRIREIDYNDRSVESSEKINKCIQDYIDYAKTHDINFDAKSYSSEEWDTLCDFIWRSQTGDWVPIHPEIKYLVDIIPKIPERCCYGSKCYRRNPHHLQKYSHPTR